MAKLTIACPGRHQGLHHLERAGVAVFGRRRDVDADGHVLQRRGHVEEPGVDPGEGRVVVCGSESGT